MVWCITGEYPADAFFTTATVAVWAMLEVAPISMSIAVPTAAIGKRMSILQFYENTWSSRTVAPPRWVARRITWLRARSVDDPYIDQKFRSTTPNCHSAVSTAVGFFEANFMRRDHLAYGP